MALPEATSIPKTFQFRNVNMPGGLQMVTDPLRNFGNATCDLHFVTRRWGPQSMYYIFAGGGP
eukprot:4024184-Pyramimonas_sp.AAC.1